MNELDIYIAPIHSLYHIGAILQCVGEFDINSKLQTPEDSEYFLLCFG